MINEYMGNEKYKLYFQDKEVILNINELKDIYEYYEENFLKEEDSLFDDNEDIHKTDINKKSYNRAYKIYSIYSEYYDKSKKQKEIIEDVAKELNIKFKSVEQSIRRNKELYLKYKN